MRPSPGAAASDWSAVITIRPSFLYAALAVIRSTVSFSHTSAAARPAGAPSAQGASLPSWHGLGMTTDSDRRGLHLREGSGSSASAPTTSVAQSGELVIVGGGSRGLRCVTYGSSWRGCVQGRRAVRVPARRADAVDVCLPCLSRPQRAGRAACRPPANKGSQFLGLAGIVSVPGSTGLYVGQSACVSGLGCWPESSATVFASEPVVERLVAGEERALRGQLLAQIRRRRMGPVGLVERVARERDQPDVLDRGVLRTGRCRRVIGDRLVVLGAGAAGCDGASTTGSDGAAAAGAGALGCRRGLGRGGDGRGNGTDGGITIMSGREQRRADASERLSRAGARGPENTPNPSTTRMHAAATRGVGRTEAAPDRATGAEGGAATGAAGRSIAMKSSRGSPRRCPHSRQ